MVHVKLKVDVVAGAAPARWPPGQVYGTYTAGNTADDGIGMVAALPARPLVALCAVRPDHVHRCAVLAGVCHDVGGAAV